MLVFIEQSYTVRLLVEKLPFFKLFLPVRLLLFQDWSRPHIGAFEMASRSTHTKGFLSCIPPKFTLASLHYEVSSDLTIILLLEYCYMAP